MHLNVLHYKTVAIQTINHLMQTMYHCTLYVVLQDHYFVSLYVRCLFIIIAVNADTFHLVSQTFRINKWESLVLLLIGWHSEWGTITVSLIALSPFQGWVHQRMKVKNMSPHILPLNKVDQSTIQKDPRVGFKKKEWFYIVSICKIF